ncbi:MAG: hypothetical protein J4G17_11950 [Anaerolineae bacterium]|nr:hypothetical protein [Anaerolineae bacterium]
MRAACLVIGHMTADLTPEGERRLGGTAAYASRTAHALGLQVRLLTSVAQNEPLLEDLRPGLQEVCVVPADNTSTFENLYDPDGNRTQILRTVAAPLGPLDVPSAWRETALVHLAPLTGEVDYGLAACFPDATVMLTPQGWLRSRDEDGLVRFRHWFDADVLRHIDIVVLSEEDVADAPELEPAFAAEVPWLFVTRAERGGTCYRDGRPYNYETPQLPVTNTTGAGDVFAAAVMACSNQLESNMAGVCRVAARLGANTITRPWIEGVPTKDEAQAALMLLEQE